MDRMKVLTGKRAAFHTLGCKLNFAETATLSDSLVELGAQVVGEDEAADICVVNSCSVTEVAEQKCRQFIRRFARRNPGALVVVMGCYAHLRADELRQMDGVSLVVGIEDKGRVAELICERFVNDAAEGFGCNMDTPDSHLATAFVPACSRGARTRYFLKVQDGCNYFCSYCTIPFARGRSRNGSIASLVEQAQRVAAEGGREIVITGVNIGDFGRSTGETFLELIKALDTVEGIDRYRISSIEPNLLTEEIIEFCSRSRAFMPHFHIPLQSGSDKVLSLMRRRYDTALFRAKTELVHRLMPDAFIGVDVIVGMRGETDELFEESYAFLESLDIAQLHVFSYSERPGTRALQIAHSVSPQEKHERSRRLIELSKRKLHDFYSRFVGTQRPVLWEHSAEGKPLQGFTDNYIRVTAPEDFSPNADRIEEFTLTSRILDNDA